VAGAAKAFNEAAAAVSTSVAMMLMCLPPEIDDSQPVTVTV
jgi:hypothetical protein